MNADAAADGMNFPRRSIGHHDTRGNAEHHETPSYKRSSSKRIDKTRSSDNISIISSAPTSPHSNFALSPPVDIFTTQYRTPPGLFQVWSAPEIPHSDRNYHNNWPSDRSGGSVDTSPLQSPRLSSHMRSTSPSMSTSPLSTRIAPDSPFGRWENNSQAHVHPLPLPPGPQPVPISPIPDYQPGSMHTQSNPGSSHSHSARQEFHGSNVSSHSAPISPVGSKPERSPIKSKWQKGKLIGRGTFGSVYVASNRETGALCAMKEVEILPDDSKSAESIRQLQQEIKVLSRLKHPNIVRYYGSEIIGDKFYIYLEYVHPGSINKFIQDHCGAITESVVRNFTRHILSGLAYLHKKKTIHRDIKGANLLVDAYGVVKLADFGMAKHLTGPAADLSLKGSPYWLAPELLQSALQKDSTSDIALAVDIWSLGCTIIEMMNGRPPWSEYEGAAAMFKVLQETPPIPETLSADGKDFLQKCFQRKPAERPSASMLLEHPFLNHMQQCDASIQSLDEMKLSENTHFLREHPDHRNGKPSESLMHDSFSPARQSSRQINKLHPD